MIWGVGTGRCGTKSLAADLRGVHEPQPWLGEDAIRCHHGCFQAREHILERLRGRLAAGVPCVDMHQSWLIREILMVDADATFIWVIRRPGECIHSLLAGGSWTERDADGTHKWYPVDGWPSWFSRFDKAAEYWREVNMMLWRARNEQPERFRIIRTESLVEHQNKYPEHIRYVFDRDELEELAPLETLYEAMLTPSAQTQTR